ncbi:Flagellar motor rotation protein MotB (plasmid) [Rhodovastum atsumiense]|uniref:flagellar motor protein MotB n=1 Tax=Rhodovastum atsumiense TaxID=504468 RepID=UPI0020246DB1|nr:flagellar motor protein MotB [Rhodovastum atsumiense]CAH2605525.1 Flagellar motor rotation protein MotB [Rhodovastum atsumiense]
MSAHGSGKRIIIKHADHGGHDEEHGGQWKVAYADFVTAMMAFFLIMWLLSITTESQRAGIAKYFTTTTIFNMKTGDGVLDGGRAVLDGSDAKTEKLTSSREDGGLDSPKEGGPTEAQDDPMAMISDRTERQRFEAVKAEFERMLREGALKDLSENLKIEMTPEGLRIQIFDRDGVPMFAPGAIEPTPRLARILNVIGGVLATVRNSVIVSGHTDAQPFSRGNYSNWELSTDRANATRRVLESNGVAGGRMLKVEGRAATDLLIPDPATDPRNRRIAITILRSDVETAMRSNSRRPTNARP